MQSVEKMTPAVQVRVPLAREYAREHIHVENYYHRFFYNNCLITAIAKSSGVEIKGCMIVQIREVLAGLGYSIGEC